MYMHRVLTALLTNHIPQEDNVIRRNQVILGTHKSQSVEIVGAKHSHMKWGQVVSEKKDLMDVGGIGSWRM